MNIKNIVFICLGDDDDGLVFVSLFINVSDMCLLATVWNHGGMLNFTVLPH